MRGLWDPSAEMTVGRHFTNGVHNHGADVAGYNPAQQQQLITQLAAQIGGVVPAGTQFCRHRRCRRLVDIIIPVQNVLAAVTAVTPGALPAGPPQLTGNRQNRQISFLHL